MKPRHLTLLAVGTALACLLGLASMVSLAYSSPTPSPGVTCWEYKSGSAWKISLSPQSTTTNTKQWCPVTITQLYPKSLGEFKEVIRLGSLSATYFAGAWPDACTPLTPAKTCYKPGEFCPAGYHGATGIGLTGQIVCRYVNGWRWERV